jgi:hypothetical protein
MNKSIKPEFEKSYLFKGSQEDYENAVDRAASHYKGQLKHSNAMGLMFAGIQPEHVKKRMQQLKK